MQGSIAEGVNYIDALHPSFYSFFAPIFFSDQK